MNRPPSPSNDPDEITKLRGVFNDGYTADDIARVFYIIDDMYGQKLVCCWQLRDEGWYQGESQFYFVDGDGKYYYDGGIYDWLNGDPGAPLTLGHPLVWRGNPVPDSDRAGPQHAAIDDGFYNCALIDKDS